MLFVRVRTIIVQKCNIFQKDHMQNTFRQASKNEVKPKEGQSKSVILCLQNS